MSAYLNGKSVIPILNGKVLNAYLNGRLIFAEKKIASLTEISTQFIHDGVTPYDPSVNRYIDMGPRLRVEREFNVYGNSIADSWFNYINQNSVVGKARYYLENSLLYGTSSATAYGNLYVAGVEMTSVSSTAYDDIPIGTAVHNVNFSRGVSSTSILKSYEPMRLVKLWGKYESVLNPGTWKNMSSKPISFPIIQENTEVWVFQIVLNGTIIPTTFMDGTVVLISSGSNMTLKRYKPQSYNTALVEKTDQWGFSSYNPSFTIPIPVINSPLTTPMTLSDIGPFSIYLDGSSSTGNNKFQTSSWNLSKNYYVPLHYGSALFNNFYAMASTNYGSKMNQYGDESDWLGMITSPVVVLFSVRDQQYNGVEYLLTYQKHVPNNQSRWIFMNLFTETQIPYGTNHWLPIKN
jgi:hypothetical protein